MIRTPSQAGYTIRRATVDDIDALVQFRVAMQREVGKTPLSDPMAEFTRATREYLLAALPEGTFIAWVADAGGAIVGTSGLIFFKRPPTARDAASSDAYIINMYTVPEWRKRGIAGALVDRIITFVKTETSTRRIFLRAETEARPVYERAGFVAATDVMDLYVDRI